MPKRTTIFIVTIFIFLTSLLFALFVFNNKQNQNQTPKPNFPYVPKQSQKAETIIYLSPNPLSIASQSGSFDVLINTSSNKATAVQLEIGFDPLQILNIDIVPGDFLSQPIVLIDDIDLKNGKISYALAITPSGSPKTGTGTVAKIYFTLKNSAFGKTDLTLLPKTLVTAEGEEASVLKNATGASIVQSQ